MMVTRTLLAAKPSVEGFTLVEIAIVMAIVALLLGGLLVPLSAQVDAQRSGETTKAMSEIREALMGFALVNGRLPCPADPAIATGSAGAGLEQRSGATCNSGVMASGIVTVHTVSYTYFVGVLPWATLGIPETDAWGRRFTYAVTESFVDDLTPVTVGPPPPSPPAPLNDACADVPTQSSFALCSRGVIDVKDESGNSIATDVPAVVVSHGKNGVGAYTSAGTQLAGATGDEQENSDADKNFVSHTPTPAFDDQAAWISTNILMNRMVAAQKLP